MEKEVEVVVEAVAWELVKEKAAKRGQGVSHLSQTQLSAQHHRKRFPTYQTHRATESKAVPCLIHPAAQKKAPGKFCSLQRFKHLSKEEPPRPNVTSINPHEYGQM